ncbi:hypothetical protein [Streptomyces sp. 3N207]|uniref:hypothetical protein n=1 Tax=Streptomyces sp. 3N207 TaxID=3457417 RepID=UPI003FD56D2E
MPESVSQKEWDRLLRRHPWRKRFWLYYPAEAGDFQLLRVCDRSGWDAAILCWSTCHDCRQGHIWKISIADHWQRQGLGRRMVYRALRGAEDYGWSTTGQSTEAQRFFPVLAKETGAAFTPRSPRCAHLKAADHTFPQPHLERPGPARWRRSAQ